MGVLIYVDIKDMDIIDKYSDSIDVLIETLNSIPNLSQPGGIPRGEFKLTVYPAHKVHYVDVCIVFRDLVINESIDIYKRQCRYQNIDGRPIHFFKAVHEELVKMMLFSKRCNDLIDNWGNKVTCIPIRELLITGLDEQS